MGLLLGVAGEQHSSRRGDTPWAHGTAAKPQLASSSTGNKKGRLSSPLLIPSVMPLRHQSEARTVLRVDDADQLVCDQDVTRRSRMDAVQ